MLGKLVELINNDSANTIGELISLKIDTFCIGTLNVKVTPLLIIWFLAQHPMVFIFLNLFDLLECPVMLMTLILVLRF